MYAVTSLILGLALLVWRITNSLVQPLQISPTVFLTLFYIILIETVASSVAQSQPLAQRLPIIVAALPINASAGLSTGFTMVSLVGCARYAPAKYGYFARHPSAREVVQVLATWVSIALWLFGIWLFLPIPTVGALRQWKFEAWSETFVDVNSIHWRCFAVECFPIGCHNDGNTFGCFLADHCGSAYQGYTDATNHVAKER
ncbi:hypothetical protein PG999_014672 [Apiospora kogelbergensis]|uniref:Uncharacterized protein n=1 Tax=Apiospora kogelbergensis TaxID=1337665 RepID=A0AAW0Q2K5_9PEZI